MPERVRELVGEGVKSGAALRVLLLLPRADARWLLARLLPPASRVAWARGCSERAKRYASDSAACASAASAAYAASDSAAYASAAYAAYASAASASASASASVYADSASAYGEAAAYAAYGDGEAEHKLACVLALELLSEVK
jgi:hypothetical protein